uniref:hypothetical protein n=1 Tax=Micromonospora sp. TaxID=1876 RepID=UPI003B3AE343
DVQDDDVQDDDVQDDDDQDDDDQDDDDQDDDDQDDEVPAARRTPAVVQDGAGWVLGLLLWGYVVLPFIRGGPDRVAAVLRAKFLNQAPDGTELP